MAIRAEIVINFNKLPPMPARLRAEATQETRAALQQVLAIGTTLAPVDTGALRANAIADDTQVHWMQPYAAFQNNGTIHIPPVLFANRAVDQVKPQWEARLRAIPGRLV